MSYLIIYTLFNLFAIKGQLKAISLLSNKGKIGYIHYHKPLFYHQINVFI